jgi:2-polyprenyl-6-methoxyphenol hydroxylase-like FAD-dependent oxidoreductase
MNDYQNYFAWFGVERRYEAHTLTFKSAPDGGGAFVGHHYRYKPAMSTFVAEVDQEAWTRTGMDTMSDDERRVLAETVFADALGEMPLISNRSIWRRWRRVDNENWHFRNIVLIGDALRTAHPSIGSGTRLAMEDAIALWRAFETEKETRRRRSGTYERSRRPICNKLEHRDGAQRALVRTDGQQDAPAPLPVCVRLPAADQYHDAGPAHARIA